MYASLCLARMHLRKLKEEQKRAKRIVEDKKQLPQDNQLNRLGLSSWKSKIIFYKTSTCHMSICHMSHVQNLFLSPTR